MSGTSKAEKATFPEDRLSGNGLKNAKQDVAEDLLLLIFMLPRKQGLEVCRLIRRDQSFSRLPLAVVKLLSQEAASLLSGDDIFEPSLQEPDSAQVVEQIKNLLGPTANQESRDGDVVEAGDLIIDPIRYEVVCRGKPIMLTALEFRLLHYLAARRNRTFTRIQLFTALWTDKSSNPHVVDVYIRRIRLKVELDPDNPVHLKTLVGRGYQFV